MHVTPDICEAGTDLDSQVRDTQTMFVTPQQFCSPQLNPVPSNIVQKPPARAEICTAGLTQELSKVRSCC